MKVGMIAGLVLWAGVIGAVVIMTGCGGNFSVYPVSGAETTSSWHPDEAKCLWGACPKGK